MSLSTSSKPPSVPESDAPDTPDSRHGILHSLQTYPEFRMLMLGTLASSSAFWMYQVAVGWLALEMTDSAFFVGMAGFAGGIPMLLISLPAGVLIDRYDRRTVLMVAQIGVMVVSTLFAVLVGSGRVAPWSLLVLVALNGTIMSFVLPTRTAIVPALVARKDMANAVALNSASQNATRVIGPSLAGVLIGLVGIGTTFAFAAILQTLALVATIRLPAMPPSVAGRALSIWKGISVGVQIVATRPNLLALIALALAPTVLVMPYLNLMPVFARDVLGLGSTGLGVLLASTGLGTVVGSLTVAGSRGRLAGSRSQLVTAVAFTTLVLVFSLVSNVPLAVVLLFIAGAMSAAFLALNQTELQLSVEDDVRGRVFSIYLLTWGMLPIGQLLVGAAAGQLGTPLAMAASCLVALASILLITRRFSSVRD